MKTNHLVSLLLPWLVGAPAPLFAGEATDWLQGHGDIAINRTGSEWRLGVRLDAVAGRVFVPDEVVIRLADQARAEIPDLPAFGFLGRVGDSIWIAPQSQAADVPLIGISSAATASGVFVNDRFDVRLTSLEGPGGFVMWTTGATGAPTVHMDSRDGFTHADRFDLPAGGHSHMNWGFTQPGTYRVGLSASGTLTATNPPTVSAEQGYHFEVGVLKSGEADIELAYDNGELGFHVHHETLDVEFEPAHVALHAGPAAWQAVPNDPAFAFLGRRDSGVLVFPQDEEADVLFLGLAAAEVPTGVFADDTLEVQLTAFSGPGDFFYYEVDAFGSPTMRFNTADGLSAADRVAVKAGSHAHRNWAFTAPGIYRVTLLASGRLAGGGTVTSEPTTFLFEAFAPSRFDRGELDLEVLFANGAFALGLLDSVAESDPDPGAALLVVRGAAVATVPADPAYRFLGPPGAAFHALPQAETEGILFLGIGADEIDPGVFAGEGIQLRLTSVDGPGHVSLYSTDALGVPRVYWNSADGLSVADVFPAAVGSHSHLHWAFSAPGVYRLGLKAVGTLAAGNQVVESDRFHLRFMVETPAVVRLHASVAGDNLLRVGWDTEPGANYRILSSAGVDGHRWTNEGEPIHGDGGPVVRDITIGPDSLRVFRVMQLP